MTNSINERNIVLVSQETELFWLQMLLDHLTVEQDL